jgi:sulfatase modifying factor 1
VSWYDVVKWCNAKSEKEGLSPVYQVNGNTYRTGEFGYDGSYAVTANPSANGYRLPSEAEWEWAARGGVSSQGYTYSGSNDPHAVGWYDYRLIATGTKAANELGIFDMSGNAWEWVFDAVDGYSRRLRGVTFDGTISPAPVAYRTISDTPLIRYGWLGFRLARSSEQ